MSATRRTASFRPLFCVLLLLGSSSVAVAREVRLQGANGDGGGECPASAAIAEVPADVDRAASKATSSAAPKAKTPSSVRGNDTGNLRAPRWHSFLPGMFR